MDIGSNDFVTSRNMVFGQAAIGSAQRIWFTAEEAEPDDGGDGASLLLQWKDGKWAARTPDFPLVSVCGADRGGGDFEVLALGVDGEILQGLPGKFDVLHVDPAQRLDLRLGCMRDISFVGESVFAVGMTRQTYVRRSGVWENDSSELRLAAATVSGPATGLNAVHGTSEGNVYAVGYGGEVFFCDGTHWHAVDSGVNVGLYRVLVLPSGEFYACGAAGVVIHGNPSIVSVIENHVTDENLYGLTEFGGRIYVSGLRNLFVIGPKGLEPVVVDLAGSFTFGFLQASDGIICSVGARHVLVSTNARHWEMLRCDL